MREMRQVAVAMTVVLAALPVVDLQAWAAQGHRLVAALADSRLSAAARAQVKALLDGADLDDIASWADGFDEGMSQSAAWHYVNIPRDADRYDRDRDCPRQPGVSARSRADRWRDCVVDRIEYHTERLRDGRLDRIDRALALRFLVHLVGDVHQPFHAVAEALLQSLRTAGELAASPLEGDAQLRADALHAEQVYASEEWTFRH